MAYQNILQYNPRKLGIIPVKEITDICLASDEREFNQEVVFSPLLIGQSDGNVMPFRFDFDSSGTTLCQRNFCSFSSDTIVSENYWNPSGINPNICPSASTLCNVGLTGIDNGLVKNMSGETIDITTGLYTSQTDKFSRYKYDRRFKMHPITGFTTTSNRLWNDNSYTYNLDYTTYGDEVGYFARLQGGFYQGFYKLAGYEYQVFPERVNLGWTAEFMLRYRWTGSTNVGLNARYPDNKGTFFYMGARAENKFYHYADGSPKQDTGYTRVTSGLTCMNTCDCGKTGITNSQSCIPVYQPSGVTSTNCNCGCPCSCSTYASIPEIDPLYDAVSNAMSIRLSGDTGNPRVCVKVYTITGGCETTGTCTTGLTYHTGTTVTEWCSTRGIFEFCTGSTYFDSEHWVQIDAVFRRREWFELCDLRDLGGLGLIVSTEYTATTANNSLSLIEPPITHLDIEPATTQVVHFKDSWFEEKKYRLGDLIIYVNGRPFMIIPNFEEIIPRLLNTPKEKQIGVGYNISLGGGTQGLHDNLTFSGGCPTSLSAITYQQDPECLTTYDLNNTIYSGLTTEIKLEELFGGSFIGDISAFRMYTEPLDASEVAHNFRLLKQRYQLLDPNCVVCVIDCPPNDLTYSFYPCPTPTQTSTPTNTPSNSPTQTVTPTNTITPTPTKSRIQFNVCSGTTASLACLCVDNGILWGDKTNFDENIFFYDSLTGPVTSNLSGFYSYNNVVVELNSSGVTEGAYSLCLTQTPTLTNTPTQTVTPTNTETNTPTVTETPSSTPTQTSTQTQTPTETPTQTSTPTRFEFIVCTGETLSSACECVFSGTSLWGTQPIFDENIEFYNSSSGPTTIDLTGFYSFNGVVVELNSSGSTVGAYSLCPTQTPTQTPTSTNTETPTQTPSETPTQTPSETPTNTPTPSITASPGQTPTATETPTPTETTTPTVTPSQTETPTQTPSETPTETPTNTASETPTSTPTETPTQTETSTPTNTETPTQTPTQTETPTSTLSPTPTETPTSTPTETPTQTPTLPDNNFLLQEDFYLIEQEDGFGIIIEFPQVTPTPTTTETPTNTPTETETSTPTVTPTNTETQTQTPTSTVTPTVTNTQTTTPTNTNTPSNTPSPTPTSAPVTTGLIIELDAYNSASYPGSGTNVVNVQSPGTYNHTLTNAPYTELNTIKCFDCNGAVNTFIRVNGTGPTLPTTGYTYISWARIKNDTSTYRTLYRTAPNDHPLLIDINTNNLGFYDNDTPAFFGAGYSVVPIVDTWVQLTVVGDSTGSTFYVNGTQVGTTTKGAGGNRHDYWGSINSQPFGYVANMFYYNRKLSLSEITQQYNYLAPRFVEPTPTPTATSTPTVTPTKTATPTVTQTPSQTPAVPVTSSLILYYDPSNPSSYSGTGTVLNDISGNGLNGTMSNITFTTPFFIYNGSTSQVTRLDNALLEPGAGDWTMEAWFNQTDATGSQVILGKFDPGGGAQDVSYAIRIIGGNVRADYGNGSTAVSTANYTTTTGITYQLVYVFNNVANNNIITYVNGVQQATTTHSFGSILNTTANLYLGSYNGGEYSQYYNGKIGITRLYNAALTSAQVLQNFNANKSKYGL